MWKNFIGLILCTESVVGPRRYIETEDWRVHNYIGEWRYQKGKNEDTTESEMSLAYGQEAILW